MSTPGTDNGAALGAGSRKPKEEAPEKKAD